MEKTLAVHPILTSNGPNLWSYACLNTHANSTTHLSVPCHTEGLNPAWAEVSDAWRTNVLRPAARVWSQVVLTKRGACELHPSILTRLSRDRTHFKSICYERLLLRPQLKAEMKRLRHVIDDPPLGRTSLARTINCRGRGSNSCWSVLFWSFITPHWTKTMIGVAQACDRRDLSSCSHSQRPESLSLKETNDYELLHAS